MAASYKQVIGALASELNVPESIVRRFASSLVLGGLIAANGETRSRECPLLDAITIIAALMLTDQADIAHASVMAHERFRDGLHAMVANMLAMEPPPEGTSIQCVRRNGALKVVSYMSALSIYAICKMCEPETDGAACPDA